MSRIRITEDNCDAIMDERRDEWYLARIAERRVELPAVTSTPAVFVRKRALSSGRLTPRSAK